MRNRTSYKRLKQRTAKPDSGLTPVLKIEKTKKENWCGQFNYTIWWDQIYLTNGWVSGITCLLHHLFEKTKKINTVHVCFVGGPLPSCVWLHSVLCLLDSNGQTKETRVWQNQCLAVSHRMIYQGRIHYILQDKAVSDFTLKICRVPTKVVQAPRAFPVMGPWSSILRTESLGKKSSQSTHEQLQRKGPNSLPVIAPHRAPKDLFPSPPPPTHTH